LVSKALQDYNDFDNPEVITPKPMKNIKVKKGIATVELPPFSVVVLEGK
jgi:alpha-N-arabinofuranosidase